MLYVVSVVELELVVLDFLQASKPVISIAMLSIFFMLFILIIRIQNERKPSLKKNKKYSFKNATPSTHYFTIQNENASMQNENKLI